MKYYDIHNLNNPININCENNIKLIKNEKIKNRKLLLLKCIGEGGYGIVYKCLLNNKEYAIKFSNNENPYFLEKCYEHLQHDLKNYIIKILYCGNVIENDEYSYYSIMEYGGIELKKYDFDKHSDETLLIIKQIYNLCKKINKTRKMVMDFKLSNILLNENNKIKLIDIYLESNDFENIKKCKIFKTNNILDISINKLYRNKNYDYSYIYVLFVFILINILCVDNLHHINSKIIKKYNIAIENKKFTDIIQLAFYKKFKLYDKNIEAYIIYVKQFYNIYEYENIYNMFIEGIHIKQLYTDFINTENFVNILNNIIIPIPEKRNIESLKKIFEKIYI